MWSSGVSELKACAAAASKDCGCGVVRLRGGGAPFLFDENLWREVGADAMGRNAAEAVTLVSEWMQGMKA